MGSEGVRPPGGSHRPRPQSLSDFAALSAALSTGNPELHAACMQLSWLQHHINRWFFLLQTLWQPLCSEGLCSSWRPHPPAYLAHGLLILDSPPALCRVPALCPATPGPLQSGQIRKLLCCPVAEPHLFQ